MKKQNKKWITLMLAGLCAATMSTAVVSTTVQADDTKSSVTASTYAITDVFESSKNSDVLGAEDTTVSFTLANGQYARIKRDLAFKWYEGKNDAKYLTVKFAFKELNFESITFEVESSSSVATEAQKTVNAVKFAVKEGKVYATVINGEGDDKEVGTETETAIAAGSEVTLALTQGTKFDSFGVTVDGASIGEFTNVGANFADYTRDKMHPLEITAETKDDAKAVVLLKEINNQLFTNIQDSKITDTAAPVLVVNEDVNGFQYGTAFSLSYEKIDVLQSSSLTEVKEYYQYNPADTAIVEGKENKGKDGYSYKTLTTSTYFMDTVYYTNGTDVSKEKKEGYTATSVMKVDGKEYVSIQITLGDDTYDDTKDSDGKMPYEKKTYDLSWYATRTQELEIGTVKKDYLIVDKNDEGATYAHIQLDDANKKNVIIDEAALQAEVDAYQSLLAEEAKDTYAGSNSNFKLPDVNWLIRDNGGYRGLKFTISYKTPSSSSAKSASSLAYNNLKFSVTEEGLYEFKVFANDKAGNTMKYYLDGELVDLTVSNVWDIEEIPSFTFEIKNLGIKVEEATSASSRKAEKILNETYTLSGLTVKGATNQQSDYALYRLDTDGYNGPAITQSALTGVKYDDIRTAAEALLDQVGTETYPTHFDLYLDIYAGKIAEAIGGNKANVKACFKKIEAYNAKITEENDPAAWEAYNKYNWNVSSKSFKTVEEGEYLILADFWEKELPMQRASAYKVVIVETEEDVTKGDSKVMAWIKNNMVSVVLFGVAAVMLILIIILLLVKPSDETLDDVDKEVEKKKKKDK